MGFGGALIWTGLTRNLKSKWLDKKVVLVQPRSFKQLLLRKPYSSKVIYENNPDIDLVTDEMNWWWQTWFWPRDKTIVVHMRNSKYQYWTSETKDRVVYREGKHAIQYACAVHGIHDAELKPRVVLSGAERKLGDDLLNQAGLIPGKYICVEPHTKTSYTPNKAWFWERWQELVDRLVDRGETVTQVGVEGKEVLRGVVDLTGQTSFRETARVLEQARLFVCCVGGLLHLSRAMGTRNVVLISAWEPKELAGYPGDVNLYTDMDCRCRGLKTPCPIGRESMRRISVDEVFDSCVTLVGDEGLYTV